MSASRMKIGLVCPYNMLERAGGVQQQVIHLADGLIKKGHQVKIVTPRPATYKGDPPPGHIFLGTSSNFVNFSAGLATNGNWTFDIDMEDVKATLESEKFDVLNFHEPWAPILARQILALSEAAHVGTFHANFTDSVAAKSLVNLFLPYGRGICQKMHIFTAVSPAPAAVLIDKARSNHKEQEMIKNIKYIPNGIDLKVYKPPKKRLPLHGPRTKTIVYVGRLEKRKGVDWLLRAFKELTDSLPNVYLIIAGEGNRRQKLEEMVGTLQVPNVSFAGYVSDEEKRRLMGNADLVCSPAMFGESFGIVLLEAMAMGAPLVAGSNSGYINVLSGRGQLSLVDAEATADFTNRLRVFLEDESVQRLLRDWGLKEVKKYDYPRVVDQYEATFKEALKILNQAKAGKAALEGKRTKKRLIGRVLIRRHAR